MAQGNLKKFFAFEWIMLWIVGLFWAAAMFLPLFLTGALDRKEDTVKNFLIMFGPYMLYLTVRSFFLLWTSMVWAYLTSNFFFRSKAEQVFANEWFMFVIFVPVWGLLMAYPLYSAGFFTGDISTSKGLWGAVLLAPYSGYLLFRAGQALFRSFGWAAKVAAK